MQIGVRYCTNQESFLLHRACRNNSTVRQRWLSLQHASETGPCLTGNSEDAGRGNYQPDRQHCPDRLKHKGNDFSYLKLLFLRIFFSASSSRWVLCTNSWVQMKSGDFCKQNLKFPKQNLRLLKSNFREHLSAILICSADPSPWKKGADG